VSVLFGSIGLVELLSFFTIGRAQGKHLELFGQPLDVQSAVPWLICLVCLLGGGFWLARESRQFKRVWDGLMEIAQPGGSP
jgi:branched-chain amino acid transport system permease protein